MVQARYRLPTNNPCRCSRWRAAPTKLPAKLRGRTENATGAVMELKSMMPPSQMAKNNRGRVAVSQAREADTRAR